ncbi:MAG: nitroreductase family deazaflavin-dependent oxidoreductase [Pseudonocardia sp.]|nr:nitroreductase family deazaflavin-dependent oxidoreductase [Pseudonocardia sp.]
MTAPVPTALRLLRTRALVRAPILAYRCGLGAVFGSRLLLLEHTGRVSGEPRYVVLEVTARPDPGRYLVVSGFGERAQWFRNIVSTPEVRVSVGRRRSVPARAVRLPQDRARELFERYPVDHPRAWARLEPAIRAACDLPSPAPLAPHVPVVEITLHAGG